MIKSHLIIVGYMGSGKSVVGKKLSSVKITICRLGR